MRLLRILSGLLARLWIAVPTGVGMRASYRDMERKVEDLRQTNLRLVQKRQELQCRLDEQPDQARNTLDAVRRMFYDRFGWTVSQSGVSAAVVEISRELDALRRKVGREALRKDGLLHSPGTPGSDETYGY